MSRCYELCHDVDCFSDTPHRCHDDECPRNTKSASGNRVKMIQLQAQVDMLKQLLYEARNPMLPNGQAVTLEEYGKSKQMELLTEKDLKAISDLFTFYCDKYGISANASPVLWAFICKGRRLYNEPSHNSADPS